MVIPRIGTFGDPHTISGEVYCEEKSTVIAIWEYPESVTLGVQLRYLGGETVEKGKCVDLGGRSTNK